MAAPFHTSKGLIQSQHQWFLWALQNKVGTLKPAMMCDGQVWEQTYYMDGTRVALSDTERNTKTDKKGKRHSYGTVTIELLATDADQQGQGAATHQLNALGKLADKWNITLRLRAMAQDGGPMTDAQLTAWYQRLGYAGKDGLYLTRLPREQRNKALVEETLPVGRDSGQDSAQALRVAA